MLERTCSLAHCLRTPCLGATDLRHDPGISGHGKADASLFDVTWWDWGTFRVDAFPWSGQSCDKSEQLEVHHAARRGQQIPDRKRSRHRRGRIAPPVLDP